MTKFFGAVLWIVPFAFVSCGGRYRYDTSDADASTTPGPVPGEPCSPPRAPDEALGILVDGTGGLDSNGCGTRGAPCKTIAQGIVRATGERRSVVYVAAGNYTEFVRLAANLRIEGGWRVSGGSWSALCGSKARQAVTLQAPATASSTVLADNLSGAAQLAQLTVLGAQTAAVVPRTAGASVYGVFARGASTQLTLEDVAITVPKGGDGANASLTPVALPGAPAGCATSGSGANGAGTGKNGSDAPPDTFGRDGYLPASGESGLAGQPGANGIAPSIAPTCVTDCGVCQTTRACATTANSCGTAGKPGCGGGAGSAGDGGKGGGSSIALYVWDATVISSASALKAAAGGQAGRRALGSAGAPGSNGLAGQPAAAACSRCSVTPEPLGYGTVLTCSTVSMGTGTAGSSGGKGGDGTPGGDGGRARGGSSCAVYRNASAKLLLSADTTLDFGAAGDSPDGNEPGLAARVCP